MYNNNEIPGDRVLSSENMISSHKKITFTFTPEKVTVAMASKINSTFCSKKVFK